MQNNKTEQITVRISESLKQQFQILCIENKTNMSDEILKFIEQYIVTQNREQK